ncbi:putative leader peptide [Actinoallomurus oryzae]|uniref:putative leader peptide n=1 Tax=Actinoallomurus oryzae TaxID=502180 RepID=UPI003CD0A59C
MNPPAPTSQVDGEILISIGETAFYAERDAAYYRVVRSWTELLTKRRAVDFCRVATALCRTA